MVHKVKWRRGKRISFTKILQSDEVNQGSYNDCELFTVYYGVISITHEKSVRLSY